ncbi:phosphoglycerate mutase-like protein [Corynespora cassiicola Philippines]|uniref:Phosphoglycerate mutase-like protein n=1 Tax=Corynespora cassiicola Philippines TaxID=1448308 RepID=A0A2T2NAP3_CORCC|nr:phosphoglycerate mutase-like protein [Corynespora cassiicola Philippines]
MAPRIHLIRHAQGFHNLNAANHAIIDPGLTPLGLEQCATLAKNFPYHGRVTKIVSSSMKRTIQTAYYSLKPTIESKNLVIIASPLFQEVGHAPCDTGSDAEVLAKMMREENIPVDAALVEDGWNNKHPSTKWANNSFKVSSRAREARIYIRDIVKEMIKRGDDSDVAIVSHGGFIHHFTEDWEDTADHDSVSFGNTEYRTYEFVQLEPNTPTEGTPMASAGSSTTSLALGINDLQVPPPEGCDPAKYRENYGLVPFDDDFNHATLRETKESRFRRGKKTELAAGRKEQNALFLRQIDIWEREHVAAGWDTYLQKICQNQPSVV